MAAVSKSQQRLMGWVHACKTGKTKNCPNNIKKVADNISAKDAKDMAKTKHKDLKEHKLTFKEFLTEVDIGDIQLSQQHQRQQQAAMQTKADQSAFKDNLADSSPDRGDVVVVKSNKYLVIGGSREGIQVKQIGGNTSTVIPHGTKFKKVGVSQSSGKNIFKALIQ